MTSSSNTIHIGGMRPRSNKVGASNMITPIIMNYGYRSCPTQENVNRNLYIPVSRYFR